MKVNKLHKKRLDVLNVAKKHIVVNGWNNKIIDSVAREGKFKSIEISVLFPKGYQSILELYLSNLNDEMTKACKKIDLSRMKTHERIREIIFLRLKINEKDKKLIRRTIFTLIFPQHSKIATSALYNTVDQIWFIAGDNSSDFNFYTKRTILAAIYSSTIFYWINKNNNLEQTKSFLDKQLKKIAKISKIKEKLKITFSILPNCFSLAKEFMR